MKIKGISLLVAGCAAYAAAAAQTPQPQQLSEAQLDSLERVAYGDTHNLDELVVTADSPLVKVNGNQLTYDVEQDPTASGQSVLDMLRKVPMVSVDGQDNISLKGASDFKIYVNGRPDPMLSQNASTILKAMPATAVSKVEVIADPGAKYDAEGTAGIINIVTERKQSNAGYNGSANLAVTNRDIMAGLFGGAKWNRLTLNANVNYMNANMLTQKGSVFSETIYPDNLTAHRLISSGSNPRKYEYFGASLSGSLELSQYDLFNFSANFYDVDGSMKIDNSLTRMESASGATLWSYRRNADIGFSFRNLTANAAWQHDFHRPDNYFALSYQFDFGNSAMPLSETYSDIIGTTLPWISHTSASDNFNRTHTIQADYSNALSTHATIEAGAKGIFRHNSAYSSGQGSNDLVLFTPIPDETNNITQLQDIYALYMLYRASYGSWGAEGGVRYEHTCMGIRYADIHDRDFTRHLNDVVPNASVTYSLTPAHALGLSYGMRISRPSLEQINPYTVKYSDTEVTRGNPNLQSERINKLSLTYRNFGRLLGISMSLDYTHTGNAISAISYLDGPTVVNTSANIGRKQTAGLNAFLMVTAVRNLRLTFNGLGLYTHLRSNGTPAISNHGWSGNISHNGEWTLPHDFTASWFGGYFWGQVDLQKRNGDYFYYGIGLARDFLKDRKLRVSLNATNFAQSHMKFNNTTVAPNFISRTQYSISSWRISIGATWNFGKTTSRIKSVNSTILNDDLSTSGASTSAPGASTPR
ncbi:MAG: outer membrane beta-barrel family protein [Muribaculaceae bacterium]|nr:outer membrane beta-barrel family protein [Muribaculaceae bacterium]